jgi:pyrroline-5-carboxylate reductase
MDINTARLAVIGSGRMGEALVRGFIRSGLSPANITVYDTDEDRMTEVAGKHTVNRADTAGNAAAEADIVILAVKPAVIPALVSEIAVSLNGKLTVSIAAGVPTNLIEKAAGPGARVVRVMPNSPAEKGAGMSAVSAGATAAGDDAHVVCELFKRVGLAVKIDEARQNVATAISGSGPAYFFYIIQALTEAGESEGLDRETAYMLAHETMFGASRMLKYSKRTPEQLIEAVRSPGGTTAAALDVFEREGVEEIIGRAVRAAAEKAKELEQTAENGGSDA